jgi:hypothetical protein
LVIERLTNGWDIACNLVVGTIATTRTTGIALPTKKRQKLVGASTKTATTTVAGVGSSLTESPYEPTGKILRQSASGDAETIGLSCGGVVDEFLLSIEKLALIWFCIEVPELPIL